MSLYFFQGQSPYDRETYRYTPILSWLLLPNVYLHHTWGKFVFVMCDVVTAVVIYKLLRHESIESEGTSLFCVQIWLFNPLTMTVSSRGNAESIMALLVVTTLYCIVSTRKTLKLIGYVLFAMSVHMKIYPVTYALPIYIYLKQNSNQKTMNCFEKFYLYLWPNGERIKLVVTFLVVLGISTGICYFG